MPKRPPPFKIFQAYEIHPGFDRDWTIPDNRDDWDREYQDRWVRNCMIKRQLQEGQTVQYCSSGNSLKPRVHSGDCTLWEPTTTASVFKKNDIVFCQVQPKDYFYAHKIVSITEHDDKLVYWIGREDETHINGWCYAEHIYGRLFEVTYCEE